MTVSAANGRHEQYAAIPLDDDAAGPRDSFDGTPRDQKQRRLGDQSTDADTFIPIVVGDGPVGARGENDDEEAHEHGAPLLGGPAVAAEAKR